MSSLLMSNHCGSCGKVAANLKACNACKLVKYCGRDCQVAHRPAHKKACREKAKELFDVQLFAQPRKREDCPICMVTLPCMNKEFSYFSCCGKYICNGCIFCLTRENCPFCNAPSPSDEEEMRWLSKRMERYKDPEAANQLGNHYSEGIPGSVQVDKSKAVELFQRASELGSAAAHCSLGGLYVKGEGVETDLKKAVHHWEIAAMMGSVVARRNLGGAEYENGNYQRAMKHFMIAARCGHEISLVNVKEGFRQGIVTKEDLEQTLRAYQSSCDETKSEQRDRVAAILRARDSRLFL